MKRGIIECRPKNDNINYPIKFDSVPHYRCSKCFSAVVVYCNDPKLPKCPWCGCEINWEREKINEI